MIFFSSFLREWNPSSSYTVPECVGGAGFVLGKKILLVPRIMVKFEPAVRGVSGVIPPGLPTLTSLRHFLPCIHPIRSPTLYWIRIKLSISAACFITWYIVDKLCYIDLLELLHPCLRIRGLTRAQILVYKICIFKSKSVPFSSSSSKASRNSKWTGF